jgi:7,8-dihydroneopterin aldolase/epimerase/oxygenase
MSVATDRIFLKGASFYGYHGFHPEENRLGQRFEVDIDAFCDLSRAGESDDLHETVNYSDLWEIAREVVEGPPKALVESVAEAIALEILDRHLLVDAIEVEIRKPGVPIKTGGLDYVGVRIHRRRDDLKTGT